MLVHVQRKYNINKILLSLLGLWPSQSKIIRNLLPIWHSLHLLSYYPLEILMLFDHWNDENARMKFESSYQLLLLINFSFKLLCEYWNHDMIRRLYEAIENHWNTFTSEIEVQILKHYSDLSRKLTIFYSMIIYIMLIIFLSIPLTPMFLDIISPLNDSRPRRHVVTFDWRIDQDKYFMPIYFYNLSIIMTGILIVVAIDTMQVTCTAHACSLFSIVGQQLKTIKFKLCIKQIIEKHECVKMISKSSEQTIYQEYIMCLKKYQLALEYVNILNSTFQTIALIMLLLTVAITSIIGVRIAYVISQLEEVMRYSFVIVGMLLQLLVLCYSSQKLMDESQNVFHQAYAAEWYNFSPRLKTLLIITLRRSFIPCSLTAGNMVPLSMMTYVAVIQRGISYFMTFLSLK